MQPVIDYSIEDFIGTFHVTLNCEEIIDYFEYLHESNCVMGVPDHQKDYRQDEVAYVHDVDIRFRCKVLEEYNFITRQCLLLYLEKYAYFDKLENLQQVYCKLQKTMPTGGYHMWHSENHTFEAKNRGLVTMVYLNDVEEGGETEFLYYSKRIKPERAKFLIFPAGFTHTHRGNPPLSGTKYIATSWIEHKA